MTTGTVVPIKKIVAATTSQQAPAGYTGEARKLWQAVLAGWALDPTALVVLDSYCRLLMRKRQAQQLIKRHGLLVKGRAGQWRANPAVVIERDCAAMMLRCARTLKLDLEPLREGPGRPGREV